MYTQFYDMVHLCDVLCYVRHRMSRIIQDWSVEIHYTIPVEITMLHIIIRGYQTRYVSIHARNHAMRICLDACRVHVCKDQALQLLRELR